MDRYLNAGKIVSRVMGNEIHLDEPVARQQETCGEFQSRFSYEALKKIPKEKILKELFLSDGDKNSMLYLMEYEKKYRALGSIRGGSPNKYPLYMYNGKWYSGVKNNKRGLTLDEAEDTADSIRNMLLAALLLTKESRFDSVSDYIDFGKKLEKKIGNYTDYLWVRKFLYLNFPEKFAPFYNDEWVRKAVLCFLIKPEKSFYGKIGQLIMIKKKTALDVNHFSQAIYKIFGCMINVHFYRIDALYEGTDHSQEWKDGDFIALPTNQVRSLADHYFIKSQGRDRVIKNLVSQYEYAEKDAKTLAKQYEAFYTARNDDWAVDVFVIANGKRLIGIADHADQYRYAENETLPHVRPVKWVMVFPASDSMLPFSDEGVGKLCAEIKNEDNLLYLYEKYYYECKKIGMP